MKQKIRVTGIVRNENGVLLLKKRMGRLDREAVWELPTGKIRFGEQPEEAITRTFYEYLGVKLSSVKLIDTITFLGLEGASQLNNLYIVYNIIVQEDEKIKPLERYSAYKYVKNEDGGSLLLDDATLSVLEIENGKSSENKIEFRKVANGATVFVDGSSRGNPGPAGIGYHIVGEDGKVLKDGGEFIGFATSRIAEYYALKEGCEQAMQLGLKSVRFVSDNLMMVNQMNGIFAIKNRDLVPIHEDVKELLKNFDSFAFVHVKRNQNVEADREANKAIDRHFE